MAKEYTPASRNREAFAAMTDTPGNAKTGHSFFCNAGSALSMNIGNFSMPLFIYVPDKFFHTLNII